jgi:superfamily II DNA or RNA helicase
LRDYQDKIIDVYIKHVAPEDISSGMPSGGGILEVPCGRGKTVMALKIISLLRQKTLIIVHKEFLMNQWIERISEFLPKAKVGKIQGPTFDIEGKDIVLGMLQTLYDRDFSNVGQNINSPFSSFGLTIIDEVHRIGSEQFSKTLLRVITPYMLGISATVERKDKLTKVLYMFIGPKIYTEKREDEDLVCVRAINYTSPDKEFNEVVQDYRGNTQYSSMITKLCAFGPRCDFIVRVIADLVKESPDSQIMILAHNRSLLTYFHEAIQHKQIAEVGFYVGGMKQKNLQETESKQIVLATYAMAAEALDIKTLSTLIMATPKTDIIQSVGRILRVRHDKPIVVDIVDSHDIFRNQWKQRKSFYKKCNYRIRSIESVNYKDMMIEWPMTVAGGSDLTWTRVFEPKSVDKSVVKTKVCKTSVKTCIVKSTSIQDNDEPEEESEDELVKPSFGCMIDLGDLQDEDYV